ncbi:restriction endonuclease [Erysipelothrix rhusiopathiae]|uniref:restriction endonuclease n=1 Tax=Erysipelothrix rhusiopathiae TaxID=1648 RepID=UPI000F42DAA3|nr:restriction endonuclease [Erysipelothrix rhusiopathiae]AYV35215.1 restriction endonuclease [Erysipelothrix rhusiopathiae]MDE8082482.1 restriction endonuclease [Erysipelothrix rhusiopathiae]MDE8315162.1 restriction endonuclease [Erysipelothrix rhusiopathiae]MDE8330235.1 restriction endonuclease [Erysipelothrix rhusiopathiae]MDE8333277.1 restriction endonuclease [Erysipelothrix rhusiopathiae]
MSFISSLFKTRTPKHILEVRNQKELINYFLELLPLLGYDSIQVPESKYAHGVNVVAKKDGMRCAFKIVFNPKEVGTEPISELAAALVFHKAKIGIVVTNGVFTEKAEQYSNIKRINLWDVYHLDKLESRLNL